MPTKKATKQAKKPSQKVSHTLSFKPSHVVTRLLKGIPDRAREVLVGRFGLGKSTRRQTLEAIGKKYGITRERVRQIENYALNLVRKSDGFDEEQEAFNELEELIASMGSIVPEEDFLDSVSKDTAMRNQIHFLLVLGSAFTRAKETEEFAHRWCVDEQVAVQVEDALRNLYKGLSDEDLIVEPRIISDFLDHLKDVAVQYRDEEVLKRWLSLSKKIDKNPLGEYGKASSPNVNLKGMRDHAYLVIRQHGSPMHFTEVARQITSLFNKKAHVATCHNELIKDSRFVLVGRGLYALSEWGYLEGVVKDVITSILEEEGPLTKEDIVDRVMKERYVKDNTIMVNLQDPKYFKKLKDGKYTLA